MRIHILITAPTYFAMSARCGLCRATCHASVHELIQLVSQSAARVLQSHYPWHCLCSPLTAFICIRARWHCGACRVRVSCIVIHRTRTHRQEFQSNLMVPSVHTQCDTAAAAAADAINDIAVAIKLSLSLSCQ